MKVFESKSVKGTADLVNWLNTNGLKPGNIVAVWPEGEWKTIIYWKEVKEN